MVAVFTFHFTLVIDTLVSFFFAESKPVDEGEAKVLDLLLLSASFYQISLESGLSLSLKEALDALSSLVEVRNFTIQKTKIAQRQ